LTAAPRAVLQPDRDVANLGAEAANSVKVGRMEKLVLFGNGAVASVLHYHLTRETDYRIEAFTVDRAFIREDSLHGVPVVPWDEVAARYPATEHSMMIAIGFVRANRLRAERCQEAKEMGYRLISYVSPKASVWDGFVLGENCRIGENVVIQPYTRIGDNVFIGSGSLIGHHSVIGEHCHISAGVQIAGNVTVEPYCYLGINATIRNRVTIASSCIIGAGAVILGDTVEKGVYMAKPADLLPITSDKLSPA
jgi:sugar O-acyltransferase (sialic acid O-acetyltransferase NeuD family)